MYLRFVELSWVRNLAYVVGILTASWSEVDMAFSFGRQLFIFVLLTLDQSNLTSPIGWVPKKMRRILMLIFNSD